jgi:hypothetical protein
MTLKHSATAIGLAIFTLAGAAHAQDAPPLEAPAAAAVEAPTGPEWWIFSRGDTRAYLIDVNSVEKAGDDVTVSVARVPRDLAAGDYTHTVDRFGIRCRARQSHVVTSSDAFEDGIPGEPFTTDEPWEAIARNSLDEGIRQIACDDMRPEPPSYDSVKAYIDAGRP